MLRTNHIAYCAARPPASQDAAACATALPTVEGAAAPPSEILLIPAGEVLTRPHDRREPWHNTDADGIVAASRELGADLVIDYDHQTEYVEKNGAKAIAAGWIKGLFARDGAVWGKVEWTAAAAKHLTEREYRFISPTFHFDRATRAIKRVVSAALTNDPALYMRAIASTQGDDDDMDELLKSLAAALGLPEGSDVNAVTAAIGKLRTDADQASAATETMTAIATVLGMKDEAEPKAIGEKVGELVTAAATKTDTPDPAKFVPIDEHKALAARVASMESESATDKATAAVEQAVKDGKVTPGGKVWALGYAAKDPEGFEAYVAASPVLVKGGSLLPGITPPGASGDLTPDEKAACKALGLSEEAFKKTRDEEEGV